MTAALTPHLGQQAALAALKRVAMLIEREAMALIYNDVLPVMLMLLAFFVATPLRLFLARPAAAAGGAAH